MVPVAIFIALVAGVASAAPPFTRWDYSLGLSGTLANSPATANDIFFPYIGTVLSSPDLTRLYAAGFTLPNVDSLYFNPYVVSLDANTGEVLWLFKNESFKYTTSQSFSGTNIIFMSASGSTVYFMFICDSGYYTTKNVMVALDGISGALKWQVEGASVSRSSFFDIPLPALSSQDDLWLPLSNSVALMASGAIKFNISIPPAFEWTSGLDPSRSFLLLFTFSSSACNFSVYNAHSGIFLWQTTVPSSILIPSFDGFLPFKVTSTTFYLPTVDMNANDTTSLLAFELATGNLAPGFPVQLPSALYAQSISIKITASGSLLFNRLDLRSPSRNFSLALVSPSGAELWSKIIPNDFFFGFYNRFSADGTSIILNGVCGNVDQLSNCTAGAMLGIVNIGTGGFTQVALPGGAVFIYPMSSDPLGKGVLTLSGFLQPTPQLIGMTLNAFSSSGTQLWTTGVIEFFKDDGQHGIEVFPVGAFGNSVLISNGSHLICLTVPAPPGGGSASASTSVKAIVGGTLGGLAGAALLGAAFYLYRGGMLFKGGDTGPKVVYTSLSGSDTPV